MNEKNSRNGSNCGNGRKAKSRPDTFFLESVRKGNWMKPRSLQSSRLLLTTLKNPFEKCIFQIRFLRGRLLGLGGRMNERKKEREKRRNRGWKVRERIKEKE